MARNWHGLLRNRITAFLLRRAWRKVTFLDPIALATSWLLPALHLLADTVCQDGILLPEKYANGYPENLLPYPNPWYWFGTEIDYFGNTDRCVHDVSRFERLAGNDVILAFQSMYKSYRAANCLRCSSVRSENICWVWFPLLKNIWYRLWF